VTRVVVADDSALLRDGVAGVLTDAGFDDVVGRAGTFDELMRLAREQRPDLVITDIRMPPSLSDEGIVAANRIRSEVDSRIAVLVLSQHLEPDLALRLLEGGDQGVGYILKDRIVDVADFVEAARRVARGGSAIDPSVVTTLLARPRNASPLNDLSPRERDVLEQMAAGRSNAGVAEKLFLSEKTVEAYVGTIFSKLGLEPAAQDHRRVLAVLSYLRMGAGADTRI
jgi:DNA-binding NarL/FixJ family response regulator